MLRLPSVFSSGALFQQNAPLCIRGTTDANATVDLQLLRASGDMHTHISATADDTGAFSLSLLCPAASMEQWSIHISSGDEECVLSDILFGELWLAGGQSNMAATHRFNIGKDAFLETLSGRALRVYRTDSIEAREDGAFPIEPVDDATGIWADASNTSIWLGVSAVGSAFVREVYDQLKKTGREIPIGFVHANRGSTPITSWIPKSAMDASGALLQQLKEYNVYPNAATWNSPDVALPEQPTCQYNWRIHSLIGLKFRGIIWYQGECECEDEPQRRIYKAYLDLYYKTYKELFAAQEHFPMHCVLLYPYAYKPEDCCLGYLNQAFVDSARQHPDSFYIVPIYDLPPVWNYTTNHPIHPTHKYDVGMRLAQQALAVSYGMAGQKQPVSMDGYRIEGNRILVHFSIPGCDDTIKENTAICIGKPASCLPAKPVGLYICGQSGIYVNADCEFVSHDTIALSHPGISVPMHAAYAYCSLEEGCNLWAGDFPVAPFRTDDKQWNDNNADLPIVIQRKPWCDTSRSSVWTSVCRGETLDCFYRPIWKPCSDSEVALDRAFTAAESSLRICASTTVSSPEFFTGTFGAYVESHFCSRLDLQNYLKIKMSVLNLCEGSLSMRLTYQGEDGKTSHYMIQAIKTADCADRWEQYSFPLDKIPQGNILRMELNVAVENVRYPFINLENIVLYPR